MFKHTKKLLLGLAGFSFAFLVACSEDEGPDTSSFQLISFSSDQIQEGTGSNLLTIASNMFPDPLTEDLTLTFSIENNGQNGNATLGEDYVILIDQGNERLEVTSTPFNYTVSADGSLSGPTFEIIAEGADEGDEMVTVVMQATTAMTGAGPVSLDEQSASFTITDGPFNGPTIDEDAPAIISIDIDEEEEFFQFSTVISNASSYALTTDESGSLASVSIDNGTVSFNNVNGIPGDQFNIVITAEGTGGLSAEYPLEVRIIGSSFWVEQRLEPIMFTDDAIGMTVNLLGDFTIEDLVSIDGNTTPLLFSVDVDPAGVGTIGEFSNTSVPFEITALGETTVELQILDQYGVLVSNTALARIAIIVTVAEPNSFEVTFSSATRGTTEALGGNSGRFGTSFTFTSDAGDGLDVIFETATDIENQLPEGTYKFGFDNQTDPMDQLSFDFSDFTPNGMEEVEVTGGTIEVTPVSDTTDEYSISFELTLEDGSTVDGTFSGTVSAN